MNLITVTETSVVACGIKTMPSISFNTQKPSLSLSEHIDVINIYMYIFYALRKILQTFVITITKSIIKVRFMYKSIMKICFILFLKYGNVEF